MPHLLLDTVLQAWRRQLTLWSDNGTLRRAAEQALSLGGTPQRLQELVGRWSVGNFADLPPVVLLPASAMPSAAGAYAQATGTIYLNQDWLPQASPQQALAVLTEELGHHLDALLNRADTPGDEGEMFAALLQSSGAIPEGHRHALLAENDHGQVLVAGQTLAVEQAATVIKTPIPVASPGRTQHEFRNSSAFAALRSDGSVVSWGRRDSGGDSAGVDVDGPSNNLTPSQIFSNDFAFATLRSDGSVVSWGWPDKGGDSSGVDFDGPTNDLKISQIFSSDSAFAALRSDGSVVSWGWSLAGGDSTATDIDGPANDLRVSEIFSNKRAFAALRNDGSVVTWGNPIYGGDSSLVDFDGPANNLKVSQIFASESAFAALRSDGSVVSWGSDSGGGNNSGVDVDGSADNLEVSELFSTISAFAALRSDGSVVSWGDPEYGGNSNGVDFDGPGNNLEVSQIFSTFSAFAALRSDGSVISWGDSSSGGDSTGVDFDGPADNLKVARIFSTDTAFAALRSDGSVVCWGDPSDGGDSSGVDFDGPANTLNVTQLLASGSAFAALRSDGSVVSWGNSSDGGDSGGVDFGGPANTLNVTQLFASDSAFAALRSDGSVVSWGNPESGGDSGAVDFDGPNNDLRVVAFADPFTDDRWVVAVPLPRVTLTVSPAAVREDGTGRLLYTFRRTGSTSSPLTVNYTVGGTATLGIDYTGIVATPAIKTIRLPSGAATAQVVVNPIADTSDEANETIALSLTPSSDYTIATTNVVTGTIHNDDIIGDSSNNNLVGTAENDYIFGAAGQDRLQGNAGQDRLDGDAGQDRLDGGAGADTLTGGIGRDIFSFRFQQSTLAQPDRITDFTIGTDRLDLIAANGAALPPPAAFSRAANTNATTLREVVASTFTDANGAAAGNQPLSPHAAALVVATAPGLAGTYLVVNDGMAGFQSAMDLVINISGYAGTLPPPGVIPVSS